MWTPCPRNIDEPVRILGLEPEDYSLVMGVLMLSSFVVSALLAFGCALGVWAGLWATKRGRAPGALIHSLHRWDVLLIRGVLRSRPQRYSPWP